MPFISLTKANQGGEPLNQIAVNSDMVAWVDLDESVTVIRFGDGSQKWVKETVEEVQRRCSGV